MDTDMLLGKMDGQPLARPDFYKVFLFVGTDSQHTQHPCLYEGKGAYEKLKNHVILGQITVLRNGSPSDRANNIENTPIVYQVNVLPQKILSNNQTLWRYMSRTKFEDLIRSRCLYFSRIDCFKDNLEGIAPDSTIKNIMEDREKTLTQKEETVRLYKIRIENNRKVSFACCWHINDKINYDLWNEYGEDSSESIGIETDIKKLNQVLANSGLPVLNEPVEYFDEPYFNQNVYWFPTLFKRSTYRPEQEYRSILFAHGIDLKGLKIAAKPDDLINAIYIHPNASKEFFEKIELFVKDNGLNIPVIRA
jgi:hypothetical protein